MKVIGVIGGSGSGKSTVSQIFSAHGLYHIDCDRVARQLVEPGLPCLEKLVLTFGEDILEENGRLNRKMLAQKAFSSPENTEKLNQITHPMILDEVRRQMTEHADCAGILVDGAALVESGFTEVCDVVVAVSSPFLLRLFRICRRDSLSLCGALERLRAQKPDSFYRAHADYVLCNIGSLGCFTRRALRLLGQLLN